MAALAAHEGGEHRAAAAPPPPPPPPRGAWGDALVAELRRLVGVHGPRWRLIQRELGPARPPTTRCATSGAASRRPRAGGRRRRRRRGRRRRRRRRRAAGGGRPRRARASRPRSTRATCGCSPRTPARARRRPGATARTASGWGRRGSAARSCAGREARGRAGTREGRAGDARGEGRRKKCHMSRKPKRPCPERVHGTRAVVERRDDTPVDDARVHARVDIGLGPGVNDYTTQQRPGMIQKQRTPTSSFAE